MRLIEHLHSTRVLIVEDERDIREALAELLRDEGYSVATANHGGDGLRVASTFRPELVLLDLAMPVVDGFLFLERWRMDPATAAIPVIVLSARQGVEAPGCEIVSKPFDLDALLATVARSARGTSAELVA